MFGVNNRNTSLSQPNLERADYLELDKLYRSGTEDLAARVTPIKTPESQKPIDYAEKAEAAARKLIFPNSFHMNNNTTSKSYAESEVTLEEDRRLIRELAILLNTAFPDLARLPDPVVELQIATPRFQ